MAADFARLVVLYSVIILLSIFFIIGGCFAKTEEDVEKELMYYGQYEMMRVLYGGKFKIGINDIQSKTGENPLRKAQVRPFYIDKYPVTNAQFWKFKKTKKRYQTQAELYGWSLVFKDFVPPALRNRSVPIEGEDWWLRVPGAKWSKPTGQYSSIREQLEYPLVHVSYKDAEAFCKWKKKRLPSEKEWEFAARGGKLGQTYPWSEHFERNRMNYWQGNFPDDNKKYDGFLGLSPVDAFPPQNAYSMYDMLGNVWEWTASRYFDRVVDRATQPDRMVLKGGSYIDTLHGHANEIMRTAMRIGRGPQYTAHNVGFRCAKSAPHLLQTPDVNVPLNKKPTLDDIRDRPPKIFRKKPVADPRGSLKVEIDPRMLRKDEL
ncbi:hypothetical protein ScPMuIL_008039 [Solemya velum]